MSDVLQRALTAHRSGNLTEAEGLYRAFLNEQPQHADALALLGLALEGKGQITEALIYVQKAVAQDPKAALFHFYLGNVRMSAKDLSGAASAFRESLALEPNRPEFHYNLGNALRLSGDLRGAKDAYEKTLQLAPNHVLARNNLALVYQQEKNLSRAIEELQRAVVDDPTYGEGWLNLCNLAEKDGKNELSVEAGMKAVALMPQNPSVWLGLGVALNRVLRDHEALEAYHNALKLKPDWVEVWDNLGQTYQFLNRLDEAEAAFRKAIDLAGQTIVDEDTRRVDEHEYGNHHWHLALLELLKGDYKRGFARYRARFEDVAGLARPPVPQPVWQGEDITGKTILVMDEQGMGDTIMLARFLPMLKARGAHVRLLVNPALVPLFEGWDGVDEVIQRGDPSGKFDVYASVFDLPYAFGTTVETIPNKPYMQTLTPDDATDLSAYPGFKIGLTWAGAPLHKQDWKRSVPLSLFIGLFDRNDLHFFSFNRDKREGDEAIIAASPMIDLAPRLKTFGDTSRFMGQMDLIITCDTSTAHLAGGMGKPTWTLLPFDPDWRWLLDREDTPWYPTMRLFRQKTRGDWAPVVDRIKAEMKAIQVY